MRALTSENRQFCRFSGLTKVNCRRFWPLGFHPVICRFSVDYLSTNRLSVDKYIPNIDDSWGFQNGSAKRESFLLTLSLYTIYIYISQKCLLEMSTITIVDSSRKEGACRQIVDS